MSMPSRLGTGNVARPMRARPASINKTHNGVLANLMYSVSAAAFLGEGGDGAGQQADFAAQFLHALRPALGDVLDQASEVGLDVAQMGAQHVVLSCRVLRDRRQP